MDHRPRKEDPFFSTNRWCHPLPALLGGRVGHGMAPPWIPRAPNQTKPPTPLWAHPTVRPPVGPEAAPCAPRACPRRSPRRAVNPLPWPGGRPPRATTPGTGGPSRHTHAHTPSQARLAMERVLSARAFRGCTAQGKQSFAAQRHHLPTIRPGVQC